MHTILLKFSSPLQSWGTKSNFETRHTDLYPSKSGVLGLVAASFGYRRNDDESIQALNQLAFGVRIDQQGNLLRDYHTAAKKKANGEFDRTYVTHRYYLEDAIFLVALSHEDRSYIDTIEEALKAPYFQPYLGRRSLPLNADFFLGVKEGHPIEILESEPWLAKSWYQKQRHSHLTIIADADLLENRPRQLRKDRPVSFSQKNRQFTYRNEASLNLPIERLESELTEHDAFSVLGGKNVFDKS